MLNQQTLKDSVSYSGIGLHSGNRVNMTILPAPANSGVRFRRVDLDGRPEIEARVENVVDTQRSTTIAKGNVKVHTVEHVLAALAGYGIDNAIVELDANEPPIADGSAREYCKIVQNAGVVPQEERREVYQVTTPIELEMGETVMTLFPNEMFKLSCTSADKQGRFTQFFSLELSPKAWEQELSHARTFCFYEEIEFLITNGLIKGGSLENAIVVRGDAVLSKEPLRFSDEFARHKILDIIGDLALVGTRIRGHVIALKPGHAANADLARAVVKEHTKITALSGRRTFPPGEGGLDINQVMEILPHRYPFLMVDRILGFEGETKCTGIKTVTVNEPFFAGHFPGHPVMPGVLQIEAMAQVASILLLRLAKTSSRIGYFMSADEVKFRKPVFPGDTLFIHAELLKARQGRLAKARCSCVVNDAVVSEGDLMFTFLDK